MSVQYFRSLLYRSTVIQKKIEMEQKRPWPNSFKLLRLKKIRLALKDRMESAIARGIQSGAQAFKRKHNTNGFLGA